MRTGEIDAQSGKFVFRSEGYCCLCERDTTFVAERDTPIDPVWYPNWFRDHLYCSHCGSIPRERAIYTVIGMFYPQWRQLDIHESSGIGRGASARLRSQCASYLESQYDPEIGFGSTHPKRKYRSEDLAAQTFPDTCFDLVITQDVFEHLFFPDRAIREIARTLRPGGAHILTVPTVNKEKASRRRARLAENTVEYLDEPQYHGNPVSEDGSLVTIDWGYDIIDYLSYHSGLSVSMIDIEDISRGIFAVYSEVFVCKKLASPPALP